MPVCARLVLGDSMPLAKAVGLGTCWQIYVETLSDSIWHNWTASAPTAATFPLSLQFHWKGHRGSDCTKAAQPVQTSWMFFLLFSHIDKRVRLWSDSVQHILSVTSRDTKRSPAKQPGRFQGVQERYFIFISFFQRKRKTCYMLTERNRNKAFRFYIEHP